MQPAGRTSLKELARYATPCAAMLLYPPVILQPKELGACVLPRFEDRRQPPFLDKLYAGNLEELRVAGAEGPPRGPHAFRTLGAGARWGRRCGGGVHTRRHWVTREGGRTEARAPVAADTPAAGPGRLEPWRGVV